MKVIVKIVFSIIVFVYVLCFFVCDKELYEALFALLLGNITVFLSLIHRIRKHGFMLLDPIFIILGYYLASYLWSTTAIIAFDYKSELAQYSLSPSYADDIAISWIVAIVPGLFYLGYNVLDVLLSKYRIIKLSNIKFSAVEYKNIVVIYAILISFKVFFSGTGMTGSAGSTLDAGSVLSLINVFSNSSYLFLVIIYIQAINNNSYKLFYFFLLCEFFCIFITGDRRLIINIVFLILLCYLYANDRVKMKTKIKKIIVYSFVFLFVVWPILTLGNDIANYYHSADMGNLDVSRVFEHISGRQNTVNNEGEGALSRLLKFGFNNYCYVNIAYTQMLPTNGTLGPVGIISVILNLLPSFIVPHESFNYIIFMFQQYAIGNFDDNQVQWIAMDVVSEWILSFGILGIGLSFILGFIARFFYFLFGQSDNKYYRMYYISNYYNFTMLFWISWLAGDVHFFVQQMLALIVIMYIISSLFLKKNKIHRK